MKIVAFAALLTALPVSAAYAAPPKAAASLVAVTYRTLKRKKAKQYEISVRYPVFAGISPVVRLANETVRRFAEKEVAEFAREAEADWKEYGPNDSPSSYSLEATPVISLARPDFISLYFEHYTSVGGAHPNTVFPAMNFGMKGGKAKVLELRDLFRADFNPYGGLDKYVLPELRKQKASLITEGEIKSLGKGDLGSWRVTRNGIAFLFAPYVVASYAEGVCEFKLPFATLRPLLDPRGPLQVPQQK